MNTLGRILRTTILGESHGACIGVVLDGCLPGIALCAADFATDIDRRRPGQVGTTPRQEADMPRLVSGLFNGHTTGAPLTILFDNAQQESGAYAGVRSQPRPGHADWVASQRYGGFADYRGGGHFSGRLTLGLVAAGVVAKRLLPTSLQFVTDVISAGGRTDIAAAVAEAHARQDSIGGVVRCEVSGVPVGWGEPFFDSTEGVLSHALFAIPAVKGVAFGSGFGAALMYGSEHNDALIAADGTTQTNHAGGINGGLTNGNPLCVDVAIKPPSSTPKVQHSLNVETNTMGPLAVKGRHDLCIALRAPVVVEAVVALVLADLAMQHRAQQKQAKNGG